MKLKPKYIYALTFFIAAAGAVFILYKWQPAKVSGTFVEEYLTPSLLSQPIVPQVLGAATDIRGTPVTQARPPEQIANPDTSKVSAKSFLAFDLDTGSILLQKNPDQKLAIASLTKLMTALVAYESLDINKNFTLTHQDELDVSPRLGLAAGDVVKPADLINAMLVGSANDAALALGNIVTRTTGQSAIDLMNQKAVALGMSGSQFSNPIGFDNINNYSTAADLEKIVTVLERYPWFQILGKQHEYSFTDDQGKTFVITTTNKLTQTHPDIEAVKTGFTQGAAGAMINKITFGQHKIITIVLDSQDREQDTLLLKQALADSFDWK